MLTIQNGDLKMSKAGVLVEYSKLAFWTFHIAGCLSQLVSMDYSLVVEPTPLKNMRLSVDVSWDYDIPN